MRLFLLIALALAAPAVVRADATMPVIEYDAPDGCSDEDTFRAGVVARIGKDGAVEGRIALTVTELGDAHRGELVLSHTASGAEVFGRRTLVAKDCDELVEAFVLVAALAWTEGARPAPPPPPRPRRLVLAAGADAGVYHGVSTTVSVGGEAFVEARYLARRFLEPAVRLHVAAAGMIDRSPAGTAQLVWIAAGLDVCPARFAVARFSFSPCARLDLGALRARGTVNSTSRDSMKLWAAPSVLGRVALRVSRRVSLEADVALVVPLVRDRYFFPPDTTLFHVPRVAGAGRLGVSVQFH